MTRRMHALVAAGLGLVLGFLVVTDPAAAQQAPLFEIESAADRTLFTVTEDGSVLAQPGSLDNPDPPASGPGVRLMWVPGARAFRAGEVEGAQWEADEIGTYSVAMGNNTTASGEFAVAFGASTYATNESSLAAGIGSRASGQVSVALGLSTEATAAGALAAGLSTSAREAGAVALGEGTAANGPWSLATGFHTTASGNGSVALGRSTVAAGIASVALGSGITAQGNGSFAFGDLSTSFQPSVGANAFTVRAFGGVGLNTGVNIGCDLPSGEGAWSCTSSRLAKEGFEDVDGEAVLTTLAGIPIQRWRYLGSDVTHLGPTAEDFREAFGLGEGSTKISTVDADGVALRAAQALERRTGALREQNVLLRAEIAGLRAQLAALAKAFDAARCGQ